MKTVRLRCKDCGSNRFEKLDDETYRCLYCGNVEHLIKENKNNSQEKTSKEEVPPQPETKQENNEDKNKKVESESKPRKTRDFSPFVNSIVKLIVTFFFGWLGVHKFMDGKVGMGILYIFTFGLFGIGYFIDLISAGVKVLSELLNLI